MLKVRLMGTTNDIKWYRKLMERDKRIRLLSASDIYSNQGTNRFHRMYAEIERIPKN